MTKPTRLLGIKGVVDKTSLSRTTIYARIKEGTFPRGIPVSTKRHAWLESEIDAWINQQVSRRNQMTDPQRKNAIFF